jgi:hypothetical protein
MRQIAAILAAVAIVLSLAFVAVKASQPSRPTAADIAAERITIERMQAVAPAQTAAAAILALLPAAAGVIALTLASAWAVAALARFRRRELVKPNAAGLLPVVLDSIPQTAPAALAAYHVAQLAAAQRPGPIAHSIHYAPRVDYRSDSSRAIEHAAEQPAALAAPGLALPVPSFAQLLDSHAIGQGQPMLLGYDASGHAIEGTWQQLYSCAVGGLSGSGKSTTVAFLAGQAALHGARIVLLDPHGPDSQSLATKLAPLAGRYLCAPAVEPADMRRAVALVADELARRKAGKAGQAAPLLFICDEFSAMQRGELAEPLAALVEAMGQEGRKLGMFAMVAGQVWSASRAGGTELRDSLASAYIHRLRPAQARMLTGLTAADLPSDLLELPSGQAYLLDTSGDMRRVTIPAMAPGDLDRVAQLLGSTAAPHEGQPTTRPTTPARPLGFRVPAAEAESAAASGAAPAAPIAPLRALPNAEQWTPEEAQIVALLAAGKGPREVVIELYGVKGGDAYSRAAAKVTAVIARLALLTRAA